MARVNRTTKMAHDGQIIAGIEKDLQSVTSLNLGGEAFTPASLKAFLQSRIDQANKVTAARATWLAEVATYEAIDTRGTVVVQGLRHYLGNLVGSTSPVLADFGFEPSKRVVQTTEQKAAAVAKRKATRAARGTRGPKARLAITGESVALAALQAVAGTTSASSPATTSSTK